ncbi:MAG TPA: hypothetical protein VGO50_09515 [Pyrinomonadaceae bacterium]|jgi:hypothetical protein|nr:hypothetical protein [Pyrinomonadaceae bacterium]
MTFFATQQYFESIAVFCFKGQRSSCSGNSISYFFIYNVSMGSSKSSKIPCHISDKVKEDEIDEIRKSVCGQRKTVKHTDGEYYCSKHRPKNGKIAEGGNIREGPSPNSEIPTIGLKEEVSSAHSTATTTPISEKEATTTSDDVSLSNKGIFSLLVVILAVGAFLDAIVNAQSLISWNFTLYGSLALALVSATSYYIPWFRKNSWIKQIEDLAGVSRYMIFGGIFVVLWLARVGDLQRWFTPPEMTVNQRVIQENDIAKNNNTPSSVSNEETDLSPELSKLTVKETSNRNTFRGESKPKSYQTPQVPKFETKLSLARARSLYSQRRYNEAVAECNKILSIQPSNKDALKLKTNIESTIRILNQ